MHRALLVKSVVEPAQISCARNFTVLRITGEYVLVQAQRLMMTENGLGASINQSPYPSHVCVPLLSLEKERANINVIAGRKCLLLYTVHINVSIVSVSCRN